MQHKLPWLHLLLLSVFAVLAASAPFRFPHQPKAGFGQFSGYITIGEEGSRSLFYYLAEAVENPGSAPLVLWLNGGPGCSSFGVGALVEHGPFRPNGSEIVGNKFGWNQVGNMLYLETPAGVGFSYSKNTSFYDYINDEITARDNLEFLRNWLEEFGRYKGREFYITGESYAGHYAPQLAHLILESDLQLKLKGVAIGNPLLDFNIDFNSRANYLWTHGVISDKLYSSFATLCNYSRIYREDPDTACSLVYSLYLNESGGNHVDMYDVALDVCHSQSFKLLHPQFSGNVDVCLEMEASRYLNRKNVKKALGATLIGVSRWETCSQYGFHSHNSFLVKTANKLCNPKFRLFVTKEMAVIPTSDGDIETGEMRLINDYKKTELCFVKHV